MRLISSVLFIVPPQPQYEYIIGKCIFYFYQMISLNETWNMVRKNKYHTGHNIKEEIICFTLPAYLNSIFIAIGDRVKLWLYEIEVKDEQWTAGVENPKYIRDINLKKCTKNTISNLYVLCVMWFKRDWNTQLFVWNEMKIN